MNVRILTPAEGTYCFNEKEKIISDKVYLGINADASEWVEITAEKKAELEAKWENEELIDDAEYAKAGKILLGVE